MSALRSIIRKFRGNDDDDERPATDGGTAVGGRTHSDQTRSGFSQFWRSDFVRSMPFWLVPFAVIGLFVYGAIGWNLLLSLTDYSGFLGSPDYSDLDFENYITALTSPEVIEAGRNTLVLLIVFTLVCLALGLGVAILLDRQVRFESTLRTIYLLPMSLSFIVTGQVWLWLYSRDGLVNAVVGVAGLGPYSWLGNPDLVLGAVIFALMWQFSGYCMVVYLAALRGIPNAHFEAARTDGASTWRMYRRVIVPQLKPATISATVVLMLFALKAFSFLYALFGGYRPAEGADILATLMVRQAFQLQQWAYSAAIAIILFVMALGIIAPYLYYQYRGEAL
jgi:glucose/mannose transport system permease protein